MIAIDDDAPYRGPEYEVVCMSAKVGIKNPKDRRWEHVVRKTGKGGPVLQTTHKCNRSGAILVVNMKELLEFYVGDCDQCKYVFWTEKAP